MAKKPKLGVSGWKKTTKASSKKMGQGPRKAGHGHHYGAASDHPYMFGYHKKANKSA